MKKIDIVKLLTDYKNYENKDVTLAGWVRSVRDSKNIAFISINDGSSFLCSQIVIEADKINNYDEIVKLNTGSSVLIKGVCCLTPDAKQPFEIIAKNIKVLCATDSTYPIQKKHQTLEYLREISYLRPRTNTFNAVFRVRSVAAQGIHKFFSEKGFIYFNSPIITSSDCEGAGELFTITTFDVKSNKKYDPSEDFFGKQTYLTPTGQLEAEAFALAFGKVYTFGPAFRAENSNTTRHANEFWLMEPEVAFADLDDIMDLEEEMIKYLINYVLEKCPEEMKFFNDFIDKTLLEKLHNVTNNVFGKITYTEAIEILEKNNENFAFPVHWGSDIQTEHERYLAETIFKKPVFVTDYPKDIKAFYMKQNEDGKTVRACDLLAPGIGEITGGSQREDDEQKLLNRIRELKLDEKTYWWYLNLRKFGSVEHSGFGIGFDRFLMYITGMSNIRDVQPCPRTPKNCIF